MTTFINNYSFMDLLKDKKYVPETDQTNVQFIEDIEGALNVFTDFVTIDTDYDFMDLLKDRGYVPENGSIIHTASNDNFAIGQIAS